MTMPRSVLIDPNYTPYYQCVSRCVRRAFLCGKDAITGYNFEHRRDWLERRLKKLAVIFAIDVCAYAVMSNHYHVVLHLNSRQQNDWSEAEVIARWQQIHKLPDWFDSADAARIEQTIALWRSRLGSISWFMRSVNEPLARFANREDGCKGRFWEGRFRSQALLDESSVLKCMAYVDLNPIRAQIAVTPESSAHTSIRARLSGQGGALAPMSDQSAHGFSLPVTLREYAVLVDWTGREIRHDKPGLIAADMPSIVMRLNRSSARNWLDEMCHLSRHYCRAIGNTASLLQFRAYLGQSRLNGLAS
jgi:REP element-mobilizing transposase RayT